MVKAGLEGTTEKLEVDTSATLAQTTVGILGMYVHSSTTCATIQTCLGSRASNTCLMETDILRAIPTGMGFPSIQYIGTHDEVKRDIVADDA